MGGRGVRERGSIGVGGVKKNGIVGENIRKRIGKCIDFHVGGEWGYREREKEV